MSRSKADKKLSAEDDPARRAAVESFIALAHNQIAATLGRAANFDMQAVGLVGLDSGLIAVMVAAQRILGPHWWVAIPGLAFSIASGGSVLAVRRFDLGPEPDFLYDQVKTAKLSGEEVIVKLLISLIETDSANQEPLRTKLRRLVIAVGVLIATTLYTTIVASM